MIRQTESGQALVEWALLLMIFIPLMALILAYGQRFIARYQLILATREAALLYSSGRMSPRQTQVLVRQSLLRGRPSIDIPLENIQLGPRKGTQAMLFQFDEIHIRYKTMEETCVIKHAPPYGATGIPGLNYGPPFGW